MIEEDLPSPGEIDPEEAREQFDAAVKIREVIEELRKCPGWKLFQEMLGQNIDNRIKMAQVQPMTGIEDVLKKQLKVGELQGIEFTRTFMDRVYEDTLHEIETLRYTLDYSEGDE